MCRVIFFYLKEKSLQVLNGFVNSFVKASEKDPYLYDISSNKESAHNDGWGYLIVSLKNNQPVIFHYKSIIPVYNDKEGVENLHSIITQQSNSEVIGILHSRKASPGLKTEFIDVHPYHETAADGTELWLAHNGSIKVKKLWNKDFDRSDTYNLLKYFSQYDKKHIYRELRLLPSRGIVKGGYNLGLVMIDRLSIELIITVYNPLITSKPHVDYLKMYELTRKDGILVYSSTIQDFYQPQILIDHVVKEVPNGTIIKLRKGLKDDNSVVTREIIFNEKSNDLV